jgi:hypothetical protein
MTDSHVDDSRSMARDFGRHARAVCDLYVFFAESIGPRWLKGLSTSTPLNQPTGHIQADRGE